MKCCEDEEGFWHAKNGEWKKNCVLFGKKYAQKSN